MSLHFAHLVGIPIAKQRPMAQEVANLMWALSTMRHTPTVDRLLNPFCAYMHTLLQSQDESILPNAQNIANMLWALAQLSTSHHMMW